MRLPSFFSGVFFWPVSESKRGKVRITFMFPSPPACHKLPFPSLVGRQLIRQQRAGKPASNTSCERRTLLSLLCVFLALPLTRCSSSLSIMLSSLRSALLLPAFSLQPSKAIHLAFHPLLHLTAQTVRSDFHGEVGGWVGGGGGVEEKKDPNGMWCTLELQRERKQIGG